MRKALVIGLNNYTYCTPLAACEKDAMEFGSLLLKHEDGRPNFSVVLYTDKIDRSKMAQLIIDLFSGEPDIALLYYAGHGFEDDFGGYMVTQDAKQPNQGFSLDDVLTIANKSKAKNRIIILDCCHAGAAGENKMIGKGMSLIQNGVTILTSCTSYEKSLEINGHGVFTNLLIEAVKGGAADITGKITPGGIYAYIDKALGPWDQRPMFKTNISSFVSVRDVTPPIPAKILDRLTEYFPSAHALHQLNPSYEDTNAEHVPHTLVEPLANVENVAKFKQLQKLQSVGLVVPEGEDYMYFAAMNSKACRLTPLGQHYWNLAKKGVI